jgi:hypothetical protein
VRKKKKEVVYVFEWQRNTDNKNEVWADEEALWCVWTVSCREKKGVKRNRSRYIAKKKEKNETLTTQLNVVAVEFVIMA